MTADTPRLRLGIVAVVALSLFAALFARLWYLQVLSAPEFRLQARANAIQVIDEPAPRGRILDRNGKVIVDNRASNVVAIDRSILDPEDRPKLLERLGAVLEVPAAELAKKLQDRRVSPYTPVPVADDVREEKMTFLLERAEDFPGVVAKRVAVRSYPMGNLAAHVIGYVGEINDDELAAAPPDVYQLGDIIGKAGVEKIYEKDLRGQEGKLRLEVDAEGNPIRVIDHDPPRQGHDLVLTIDADVQRVTEDGLREGLESTERQRFIDDGSRLVADAGAAVVLDVVGGGVLAMASFPTFDLPGLADGISTAEAAVLFPKEETGTAAPFLNRAITGRYAPGSTWKLVTADAALRTGLITPNFSLYDGGTYTIPGDCAGRGCLRRNAGSKAYQRVGVQRAMAVSSDVFFYHLGAEFWQNRRDPRFRLSPIQDSGALYGFGSRTQVPLPSESPGLVLTPALRAQLFEDKSPLVSGPDWYTGDNVNLAIGQDAMTVTPIQLANAYGTLANGGRRHQPNIALRVQRQDGTVMREFAPRVQQIDLPSQVRDPILAGMRDVVSSEEGTAYNAFAGFPLSQYGVAGKTGTAQAPPKQDTALFAAYGPTQDPKHAVTVVMEQSGFGASAAAPVARRIFAQLAGIESAPAEFTQINGAGD